MITLRLWLKHFGERFSEEELNTGVYKAIIRMSTINPATGDIECHRLDYDSKEYKEANNNEALDKRNRI